MHILLLLGFIAQVYFINHAVKTAKPRYWIVALLIPLAGCLVYFLTEYLPEIQQVPEKDQQDRFGAPSSIPSEVSVGYISRGKLFHQSGKEHPNQIHSPFGQKMIDQAVRVNQSNDWKTKGSGSPFKGGMLWGVDNANADAIRVNITSVTKGREEGSLFYILESETTSGLFYMIGQPVKRSAFSIKTILKQRTSIRTPRQGSSSVPRVLPTAPRILS